MNTNYVNKSLFLVLFLSLFFSCLDLSKQVEEKKNTTSFLNLFFHKSSKTSTLAVPLTYNGGKGLRLQFSM